MAEGLDHETTRCELAAWSPCCSSLLCSTSSRARRSTACAARPAARGLGDRRGNQRLHGTRRSPTAGRRCGTPSGSASGSSRTGWDNQHQVFMSDSGAASGTCGRICCPSQQNLDWAIRGMARSRSRRRAIWSSSTSPASPVASRRATASQLDVRHYLLPVDADPGRPEQTGWSLDQAVDECVRHKLRVVCWLATAPGDPAGPAVPPRVSRGGIRGRASGGRRALRGWHGWPAGPE